ncbi:nuclear transport factor 2 family protein [Conexibacter sp. SYSU D00693]|uniref:nuclear transport factor 2 family protein n=1 Tax=Conexibacter sp. SYSU D00693 TaxID=2812560 RepID=UPI00196B669F|nr:nuclear transport factor 2 family protein [Conexibacter sp. SYSU D00693]
MTRFVYGAGGSSREHVAVVTAIYAAFARRDLEGALEHLAEDVVLWPAGTAQRLGREEPYRGHDGVRRYFADAEEAWDELVVHARDVRAAGAGVVVFGHVDLRLGERRVVQPVVWVWQLRGDKAVSMRVTDLGDPEERGAA